VSIVNELLKVAKHELAKVKLGEVFLVSDLFKKYEWNRISRSDRLLLGTLFRNFNRSVEIDVDIIEKNFFWSAKV